MTISLILYLLLYPLNLILYLNDGKKSFFRFVPFKHEISRVDSLLLASAMHRKKAIKFFQLILRCQAMKKGGNFHGE